MVYFLYNQLIQSSTYTSQNHENASCFFWIVTFPVLYNTYYVYACSACTIFILLSVYAAISAQHMYGFTVLSPLFSHLRFSKATLCVRWNQYGIWNVYRVTISVFVPITYIKGILKYGLDLFF